MGCREQQPYTSHFTGRLAKPQAYYTGEPLPLHPVVLGRSPSFAEPQVSLWKALWSGLGSSTYHMGSVKSHLGRTLAQVETHKVSMGSHYGPGVHAVKLGGFPRAGGGDRNHSSRFMPQSQVLQGGVGWPQAGPVWIRQEWGLHFTPFLTLLSPGSALQLELECPRTSKRLSPSTQTALCQLAASWEDITGHHPSHTWAHRDCHLYSALVSRRVFSRDWVC